MGYGEKEAWHPWLFIDLDEYGQQVGGYAINYKVPNGGNFTFLTVRGGRHEVPETAPKRAFEMFSRLIDGESF
jgi:cathepsin A (carboxypeptidase C)/serine carboxypeptidase-like clade 1